MHPELDSHSDLTVKLQVRAQAVSVSVCRRFVAFVAELVHFDGGDDLQVIVSELVTNSVRHAGVGHDSLITVSVHVTADRIEGAVIDSGDGFRDTLVGPRPDGSGGFGLHIVDHLADRWYVRQDGHTGVYFEMERAKREHRVGADAGGS